MRRAGKSLTIALGCAAWACGDGTAPATGSFTATVSGDLTMSLSGEAIFGASTTPGEEGFVIAMTRGDPASDDADVIVIARDSPTAPGSGAYVIQPVTCDTCSVDDFAAALVATRPAGAVGLWVSHEGAFTLTSAGEDRLVGTFEATVVAFFAVGEFVGADTLMMVGSFSAVPGDVTSLQ